MREEMVAITEEQNSSIEIIYGSIGNINDSSIKLQELIEKRNEIGELSKEGKKGDES